jgi:hypothetical protein
MCITTFLADWELNQPLHSKLLTVLLNEVRTKTERNWQIVERTVYVRPHWWSRKVTKEYLYELYLEVGGVGPYQQINFYRSGAYSSINIAVEIEIIAAYLYGVLERGAE